MLSEVSQLQEDKSCMIPLTEVSRIVKFIETDRRMVFATGWGAKRNGQLLFNE